MTDRKIITEDILQKERFTFNPRGQDQAMRVQKKLLDMGCRWMDSSTDVLNDRKMGTIYADHGIIYYTENIIKDKNNIDVESFLSQPYPQIRVLDTKKTLIFHPDTEDEARLIQLRLFAMGASWYNWKDKRGTTLCNEYELSNGTLSYNTQGIDWNLHRHWRGVACHVNQLPQTPSEKLLRRVNIKAAFAFGIGDDREKRKAIRLKNPRP